MLLAVQGIIPDQQYYHDPQLKNKVGETVAMILANNKILVPREWQHDPELCNMYGNTVAMIYVSVGIIPPKEWEHDKKIRNCQTETVAEILAHNYIIPPQQWMINNSESIKRFRQIKNELYQNQLPVPERQYKYKTQRQQQQIFTQACYRIIPDITGHKPEKQDEDGFTVAMILACNNVEIPNEWYHDSNIKNKYGYTVALYMARNGKIPDKQWYHNKLIRGKYYDQKNGGIDYCTVQNFLQKQNIKVPEEWQYEVLDEHESTQAMDQAMYGQIPDQKYYHDPEIQDINGWTVATTLANRFIVPPKEWECDKFKTYRYFDERYDGMDLFYYTVAEILAYKGIVPTQHWMITEDENKDIFDNIKRSLKEHDYEYIDGKFVHSIPQIEKLNNICQICLNEGEQQFIKTTCGHKICSECFKQLKEQYDHESCPFCRQYDWYEKIIQN